MQAEVSDVFTVAQAMAAGLSDNQLRGKRYHQVFRGVYTTGDPSNLMVRARAALLLGGTESLLGGVTVLQMCGVWLPSTMQGDVRIHIVVPPGRLGPQMPSIKVIRASVGLPPIELGDVLGVHPAQAWLQVATQLAHTDLVVAADSLMRRKATLATHGEIEDVLARRPGARGVAVARRALAAARAGVESPMESRLRLAIVTAGLECPQVDYPFQPVPRGKEYRLDMAYPKQRLAVEYDGGVHADAARMRDDRTRRRLLEDAGWRVITATAADMPGFESVIASIRAALAARAFRG